MFVPLGSRRNVRRSDFLRLGRAFSAAHFFALRAWRFFDVPKSKRLETYSSLLACILIVSPVSRVLLLEMNSSHFRLVAACLVLWAILAATSNGADSPRKPPNIVVVLVDDLGATDLGCFGSPFYETPNVDRLAATGMRFTTAYSTCPVCSPTRASMMTGRYPQRTDITDYIGAK